MRIDCRYRPILNSLESRALASALDSTEPVVPPTGPDIADPGLPPPRPALSRAWPRRFDPGTRDFKPSHKLRATVRLHPDTKASQPHHEPADALTYESQRSR
jgi:hypothetical protein